MEQHQSQHVIQGKVVTSDPPLLISNDMDPSGYDYALSDGTDYAFSHTSDNISIKQEPETDTPEDNKFLNFAPPQFDELNMLVYEVLPRLKLPEDGRCVNPKISESCISPTSSLSEGQSSQSTDKSYIELMSTSSGLAYVDEGTKGSHSASLSINEIRKENCDFAEKGADSDATLSDDEMRADHQRNQGPRKHQLETDTQISSPKETLEILQHRSPKHTTQVVSPVSGRQDTRGLKSRMSKRLRDPKLNSFKCAKCLKDFSSLFLLQRHETWGCSSKSQTASCKSISCDQCSATFSSQDQLNAHKTTVCSEKPQRAWMNSLIFKCLWCSVGFDRLKNLEAHAKTCSANTLINNLQSPMANDMHRRSVSVSTLNKQRDVYKSSSNRQKVSTKTRKQPREKQFKCDWCHSGFTMKCNLITHKRKYCHHSPNSSISLGSNNVPATVGVKRRKLSESRFVPSRVTQSRISESSASIQNVSTTKYLQTNPKEFKCNWCHAGFTTRRDMIAHQRKRCRDAPKSTTSKRQSNPSDVNVQVDGQVVNNLSTVQLTCEWCHKRFPGRRTSEEHRCPSPNAPQSALSLSNRKRFKCDLCHVRFTRKSNIVQHKKYSCPNAPKSAGSNKAAHAVCDLCNTRLSRPCLLRRHKKLYCPNTSHPKSAISNSAISKSAISRSDSDTSKSSKSKLNIPSVKPLSLRPTRSDLANSHNKLSCRTAPKSATSNSPDIECNWCHFRFSRKDHLIRHQKCSCPKAPKSVSSHSTHYVCDLCHARFVHVDYLTRHKKKSCRHVFPKICKPKPFKCDWCTSGFTRHNNLVQHKEKRCRNAPKSDDTRAKPHKPIDFKA
eukprot:786425_1